MLAFWRAVSGVESQEGGQKVKGRMHGCMIGGGEVEHRVLRGAGLPQRGQAAAAVVQVFVVGGGWFLSCGWFA
mgnify:CR=1 FL=1